VWESFISSPNYLTCCRYCLLLGSSHQFPIVMSIVITMTVAFPPSSLPLWILFFYNFTPVMTHFNHSVHFHTDPFHRILLLDPFKLSDLKGKAIRNRPDRPSTNPTSNATLYQKGKSKGRDLCLGFFFPLGHRLSNSATGVVECMGA